MKVSSATIDITPHTPVKLCGYVNDIRTNQRTKTAHHPIYAIALRLACVHHQVLFLTLDILSISKRYADEIKHAVMQTYDIKEEEIVIHAIHTHAGPSGFSVDAMGKEYEPQEEYRQDVIHRIVQGLQAVFSDNKETKAKIAKVQLHGYFDNRNDANRYYDAEAFRIRFYNESTILAEFISMNVHSTVLGPFNMEISYDLIGTVRELLYEAQGVRPMICIGTSADISNRHYRQGDDFKELHRTAQGIVDQLQQMDAYEELDLHDLVIDEFTYHLHYDNRINFPQYEKELNEISEQLKHVQTKTEEKLLRSSKQKLETKLQIQEVKKDIRIMLLRFPQLLMMTFPGELTSIFGKYCKEHSSYPYTFFITCANDHHGYFLEEEMFGKCYEATATLIPKGEIENLIQKLGNLL